MPHNIILLLLFVGLLTLGNIALGDAPSLPAALQCEFGSYASAVAEKGESKFNVEILRDREPFALTYAAVNSNAQTAQLVGNTGASTVEFVATGITWAFVEVTAAGNINVTQAYLFDEPNAAKGIYRAVHSRQSTILGVIVASQHYGYCRALY